MNANEDIEDGLAEVPRYVLSEIDRSQIIANAGPPMPMFVTPRGRGHNPHAVHIDDAAFPKPTPASGDPEKDKMLNSLLAKATDQTQVSDLEDACKAGPSWTERDYMRDRSGSKKKVRKSVNRAKAKAARKARKAQR
jgi:hypothetical protein